MSILIGLARIKVVAILLGPAGVGMVGLLQSLVGTGAATGGLGIPSSGVRQIAEDAASGDEKALTGTRSALFWGSVLLAAIVTFVFWLFGEPIAVHVLGDRRQAAMMGWIGLAAGLTILVNAQGALLNGFRRIGDIARVGVYGTLLGTVLGIAVLLIWREEALVAYVVIAPLALVITGVMIARRLPRPSRIALTTKDRWRYWLPLFKLGISFMGASIAGTLMLLIIRSIVGQRLGAAPLGEFSAAWTVSMTYTGFVLTAMAADYYPRLTAAISDPVVANRMVNEQSEIGLLLAAPVLIGVQAAAPWVIRLLYSSQFDGAVDVLRWQIAGDVLKIIGWPLGFVTLAAGRGRVFLAVEVMEAAFFSAFIWLTIDALGLAATGVGFLLMYAIYVPTVYLLARRQTGFRWTRPVASAAAGLMTAVALTGACGMASDLLGFAVGSVLAAAMGVLALLRLDTLGVFQGKLARLGPLATALRARVTVRAR
ncbi:MAG TPA: O-antigen translocase [Sphingomonas sp.]